MSMRCTPKERINPQYPIIYLSGVCRARESLLKFFPGTTFYFHKSHFRLGYPNSQPLNPYPTPNPKFPVVVDILRWSTLKNPGVGPYFGGGGTPKKWYPRKKKHQSVSGHPKPVTRNRHLSQSLIFFLSRQRG